MKLTVTITQEDYELIDRNLHAGLDPKQWLQDAINGKVASCFKRESPLAVAEARVCELEQKLERQASE